MIRVTTFPIEQVQQLRREAEEARALPDHVPQGWSKSVVDPKNLLAVFGSLRIREGFVLRAYQLTDETGGKGYAWAMPDVLPFPAPEDCPEAENDFLEAPRPPGALDDFMEAVEGDGSPWSYVSASLFARELVEFGTLWHDCNWTNYVLLGSDPMSLLQPRDDWEPFRGPSGTPDDWHWRKPKPLDWRPQVCEEGSVVTVSFFT